MIFNTLNFLFDVTFALLLSFRSKKERQKIYENIIIKPDNLGDVVLLCSKLRECKIIEEKTLILVRPEFIEIVKLLVPEIEVLPIKCTGKLSGLKSLRAAAEYLSGFTAKKLLIPVVSRNFYNSDIYAILLRSVWSVAPCHDGQNSQFNLGKLIQRLVYNRITPAFASEARSISELLLFVFGEVKNNEKQQVFTKNEIISDSGYVIVSPYTTDVKRDIPVAVLDKVLGQLSELNIRTFVVGSNADRAKVKFNKKEQVVDLVGSTSIPDLFSLTQGAVGVICAETGTLQIATYLNKNKLVFVGGGHFGRYFRTESTVSNLVAKAKDQSCFNCGWSCTRNSTEVSESYPCIKEIEYSDQLDIFIEKVMKSA